MYKEFYNPERKCYVDEWGRFIRVSGTFDPTVHRDGYFFSKEDEEEYIHHLKSLEDKGSKTHK
jgi:hypothetical protein